MPTTVFAGPPTMAGPAPGRVTPVPLIVERFVPMVAGDRKTAQGKEVTPGLPAPPKFPDVLPTIAPL
jgi:hypothetical protein